ncbi:S-adenosyl-L-methionine-dependent methyltransferase, partial [Lophium mytilinum]
STRTLQSIDLTTITENDRTYPDEHYYMPCDAVEQDRLSILHRVYLAALGDKLTTAPITAATTRMLDVGTGPGDWAVGISERFPYAEVVGIDLTIWDVEAVEAERQGGHEPQPPHPGWNFTEPFDYIHIRGLKGAFASWPALYAEAYTSLAPGGWIEVVDYSFAPPDTPDILNRPSGPTSGDSPAFTHLFESTRLASLRAGLNLGTAHLSTSLLTDAGFVDVRATQVNVPVGTWPSDARQKALGKLFVVCLMEGFESVCLRLLTRYAGWGKEEVREL